MLSDEYALLKVAVAVAVAVEVRGIEWRERERGLDFQKYTVGGSIALLGVSCTVIPVLFLCRRE